MSLLNLVAQAELGLNHPPGEFGCKPAFLGEPGKLGLAVTGHDDDTVELIGRAGFVEQWNINEKPVSGLDLSGHGCPAGSDGGVEDMFKGFSMRVISEHEFAEFRPVRTT